ncbi:MAG: hypothetical protein ABIC40_09010 [bacterium]
MKHITLFLLAIVLMLPVKAAIAYSDLADDFLLICSTDAPFPPENWSKGDLRAAALEVLDGIETGGNDRWPLYYCLITLGYGQNPDDVQRILAYEEDMPSTVLRSLRGFPDPDAIECMLKWAASDRYQRELAFRGLGEIDFDLLEDGDEWRDKVISELLIVRKAESNSRVIESIDEAITQIQTEE